MLRSVSLVLFSFGVAACGGGGDDPPAGVDAPVNPGVDAPPSTVQMVTCDGTESASVESTGGFRFAPAAVTISAGQVVKFTNGGSHSIVPVPPMTDDGLRVGFGATTCLRFTAAGTYNYRCSPHTSMTGSITVN